MRLVLAAALAGLLATPGLAIELTSPDVKDGASFDLKFVCSQQGGQGISPALAWTGVPAGAKSLAVTIHDPDAPVSGGFWHWLTVDIPPTATGLDQGAGSGGTLPAGAMALPSGTKKPGYIGPCPPQGDGPHHYMITVMATDLAPTLAPGLTREQFLAQAKGHLLTSATIGGLFARAYQ